MFTFANCLLLALFAAAVFDFATALRAKPAPGVGGALKTLWHTEHFLFGPWGAAQRVRCGQALFMLCLALYEFQVVFCNSMARENWPWLQTTLSPILDQIIYWGFGLKILLGTKYDWCSLAQAGALYFIARWVYFNGQNIWWIGLVVGIMAAKDMPLDRAMRAFLASGLTAMAAVQILHFAGIVAPDAVSERNGDFRQMFGYGHPNTFGGLVFGLLLAWVVLHRLRPRWRDVLIAAATGVFLLVGPASRSSGLCALGLALLLGVYKLCQRCNIHPKHPRALSVLAALPVAVVGAVSYILPLFVVKIGPWADEIGPAWLAKLDGLLTCRISLAWAAYRVYPIKIAGQFLLEWPALDNTFVYLLYQFGPVAAALAALLLAVTLYRLARQHQWAAVACLLAVLVYAAMENQALHLTSNPAALLLAPTFFALYQPTPRQSTN